MNEPHLPTPLTTPQTVDVAHKPRKRELKNLTRREGIWYFHKRVNGKKEFNGRRTPFSLETRDLAVAKARRDAIIKAANGAEIDRVLGREHRQAAKVLDLLIAYRKAPTVRANAATRERNIADLVRLVRFVRGEHCNVEALASTELTKQLVKEWQTKKLAAAAVECAGDLARLEGAKRSLNSLLTHVQSLFSAAALDDYGALHLPPNISEFSTALPIAARKQEEPTQLTDAAVTALLDKIADLQKVDAGAWATFQLMTWGGLRNKECLHARESWLEPIPGGLAYRLTMKAAKDFLPKGNSRAIILPEAVAVGLLAQLPADGATGPQADGTTGGPGDGTTGRPDRYLVPGEHYTDRHEAVYRRLNAWLKTNGVGLDAGKIAYRLRKYWAKKLEEQQGIFIAQAGLGHSSAATTQAHYTGTKKMAEPIRLS